MAQTLSGLTVGKLYQSVIDDVMTGVRDCFLDEGVDEQVLQELRMLWESKLIATKCIEQISPPNDTGANNGTPGTSTSSSHSSQIIQNSPVIRPDPNAIVPIQITIAKQPGDPPGQKTITLNVPAACIHSNKLLEILALPTVQPTLALPVEQASIQLQEQVNAALKGSPEFDWVFSESVIMGSSPNEASIITSQQDHAHSRDDFNIVQVDGQAASSNSSDDDDDDEDEDDDDFDDDIEDKEDEQEEEPADEGQDEESLNSGDDLSDSEESNVYDVDNVVVCQYDKITRIRNRWKFHLKDGIMNINGKDYVFQRSTGDAEW